MHSSVEPISSPGDKSILIRVTTVNDCLRSRLLTYVHSVVSIIFLTRSDILELANMLGSGFLNMVLVFLDHQGILLPSSDIGLYSAICNGGRFRHDSVLQLIDASRQVVHEFCFVSMLMIDYTHFNSCLH